MYYTRLTGERGAFDNRSDGAADDSDPDDVEVNDNNGGAYISNYSVIFLRIFP